MSDSKTCTIRFDGHRYYIGYGPMRSRTDYKTFAGACRTADKKDYTIETLVDPKIEYMSNEGKTKIVTNLLSGQPVEIPVNTPSYCDPSSESYWSM